MAYIRRRETNAQGMRWDVRHVVNGQRRTDTFRNEKDAKQRLTKVRSDELVGLIIDLKGGEQRLGEYAEHWLETRLVKGEQLRPMTKQGYKALFRPTSFRRSTRPSCV